MRSPAHVLVIDDQLELDDDAFSGDDLWIRFLHPERITAAELTGVNLVLADFYIAESWPALDEVVSLARNPGDGLAVIATIRSRLLSLSKRVGTELLPVAFGLLSGNLSDATGQLPVVLRAHAFARANNIEWAFDKGNLAPGSVLRAQIRSLAEAVDALPEHWPSRDEGQEAESTLMDLLALPNVAPWRSAAEEGVRRCRPPLHEMSERSHGLATLRWLAHRILPYPCFLFDERYLACRLRIPYSVMTERSVALRQALEPYRYGGILDDFQGDRWWRAGVESWLWESTDGGSGDPEAVRALVSGLLEVSADALGDWRDPVVVLDEDYRPRDDFVDLSDAVQIAPDDWPIFADAAWAARASVESEPALRALVPGSTH